MSPINPVLEPNQSSRRTEGPIYWSSGSTAHLNAFWYPFCFPWKERFHYTSFFYYWREDSTEAKSDGSKIKRWHFNYRTLIKASGWCLRTRPPLIVPPDALIKCDCSGKKRSQGRHKGETQLAGNLGIWTSRPAEMKTHLQTKRAQYPKKRPRQMSTGAAGFSSQTYYHRSREARP